MKESRTAAIAFVVVLVACSSSRRSKNDEILACNSSGGRWVEGGCNSTGRCERGALTAAPDDEDDPVPTVEDDELIDGG